jgi:hypothetical protein
MLDGQPKRKGPIHADHVNKRGDENMTSKKNIVLELSKAFFYSSMRSRNLKKLLILLANPPIYKPTDNILKFYHKKNLFFFELLLSIIQSLNNA